MAFDDLKIIPLEDAFEIVFNVLKSNNLSQREEAMLESLILSCPQISEGGDTFILKDDLNNFCRNFIKALREGDASFLHKEKGYKGRLVDVEEFIESKEYMNQKGSVRPLVKYEMGQIVDRLDNTREVVLSGATSWGKTYLSRLLMSYILYKLSMLHNPQYQYELSPGSSIVMILQSVSLRQSRKIIFDPLLASIASSKYFVKNFPFNKQVTSELQFPNHIYVMPVSGSEMATLGLDVYAGCFLEDQEYLNANGFFTSLNSEDSYGSRALRFKDSYTIEEGDPTRPVFTGFKPLVKLTLDNGDTIISSSDQLFLKDDSEGVAAKLCEGSRLLFSKESNILKRGYNVPMNPSLLFVGSRCIRVEDLGIYAPVYDLENVGGSHYFFARTQSGVVPAKNCISELNYFNVVENSKMLSMRGQEDTTYDQASNAYTNLIQRLKSRFQTYGKIPGCLVLDSAVHYPGDFLDRKIQEAKWDNQIHVVKHAVWEAMSPDRFSGNKFLVEIGTADRSSRIITDKEFAISGADLLEVPEEYRTDFDRDIEKALRDFAGVATGHRRAFMPFKDAVVDAWTVYEALYEGETLFTEESIDITNYFPGPYEWELLINDKYLQQVSFNAGAAFCMHMDLGISKDCVGLSVGHIQEYKEMPSSSFYSRTSNTFTEISDIKAPVICIDGMMEIRPPVGGEVDVDTLRGFMLYLCHRLNIKIVTMDSFEHVSFVQAIRKIKGVRSGVVSTVSTPLPYMELKSCYVEGRIIHQKFDKYIEDLLFLEFDPKINRIDHIPSKSKDIPDSTAGVVHMLTHKIANYKRISNKTQRVPAHRQVVVAKL